MLPNWARQTVFPTARCDDVTKETVERRDAGLSYQGTTLCSLTSLLMTFSRQLVTVEHTWFISTMYKFDSCQRMVPVCIQSSMIFICLHTR